MALSDSEREKKIKRNKNRAIVADSTYRWSDKQKLEAIHSWLTLGNLALTSRILGIPEVTLRVWKASDWWKQTVDDIKLQEKIVLSNRMKSLVEAAQTIVQQRLEQGDPVITPKGELVYKPVSLKDAHKVATDLIDRKVVLDKATNDDAPSEEKNVNKLEELANKFAEMAMKSIQTKQNKERTVDAETVEVKSAVHVQREEGLQKRVSEISLSPGTNQESYSQDHGSEAS